jgi:3-keto-disaccharide hydrolase
MIAQSIRARVWPACAVLGMIAALTVMGAKAQQPPAGPPGGGQGRPGGQGGAPRGPIGPEPFNFEDHAGFDSIFDGTMKGWDGDPTFWRAEGNELIGETTPEKPLKVNTFLVWRGGEPKDFELKLEYRMNATNSGVQYRSVELTDVGKWVLKGYQADIDFDNRWTGQLYEERGRGFLALRGQASYVGDGLKPRLIGTLENGDALKAFIKVNDWNQVHIIARGTTLVHIVNGHVMSVTVDDDTKNRALSGLLGFQIHVGQPMKVEFRNIWLKRL